MHVGGKRSLAEELLCLLGGRDAEVLVVYSP